MRADHVRARNTSSSPPLGADPLCARKLVERSLADDAAAAQQNETIANARGVAQLVDRQKQRAPCRACVAQDLHDVARLPEIESVERLVEHQQRLRRQQADREQHAPVFALGQLAEPRAEQRLESERRATTSSTRDAGDAPCRPAMKRSTQLDRLVGPGPNAVGHEEQSVFALGGRDRVAARVDACRAWRATTPARHSEERRLARAVRPDQPQNLSGANRKRSRRAAPRNAPKRFERLSTWMAADGSDCAGSSARTV